MTQNPPPVSAGQHSGLGCVARFFWMAAGNAILAFLLVFIAQRQGLSLTWRDAAYWLVVLALLAVRLADIRWFGGRTTDDAPATMSLWRKWAPLVVIACLVLWAIAHLVARLGWLS
ncbi:MAG TPA: hypothetical protein PLS53_04450 [Thermoanaerobaculaceae bacterium]|nr:hypothetical protein [Thermoanaerobaculaceae bacterium]HPS77388.1 hypothetical protein [Thermoanaerobaculaceae bacterium]